jgi:4,5-DOPA dioxygenase extradiol
VPAPVSRRGFLAGLAAGAAGAVAAACHAREIGEGLSGPAFPEAARGGGAPASETAAAGASAPRRMPAAFVGHGSPMTALDAAKSGEWTRWAASMPRPRGVLVVSAHWEEAPPTIGPTVRSELVYDFSGFPDAMYAMRYDAPLAPWLADRVEGLLARRGGSQRDEGRGLDHGAWVPLRSMYPRADVPVVGLSLPSDQAMHLLALGRALAPLRDEGVLILGSGNVTHNLRRLGRDAGTPSWASEFDAWLADALVRKDARALADWRRAAPGARIAHPTVEHLSPVLVAAAAAFEEGGDPSFPISGFEGGSISRRCVTFA